MLYNILGDIHGRRIWKDLVVPDAINVFVGDYLDPYNWYTHEELMGNLQEIIQYKKDHPETILLLGNHDLHYFHLDDHSRLDFDHRDDIVKVFQDNIDLFQVAYSIQNKILVTHAGVSQEWLDLSGYDGEVTPDAIADHINHLSETPEGMEMFKFTKCRTGYDMSGTSPTQSPVWIRPMTLVKHNALEDYIQVVGHTQVDHIERIPYPIWLVDCLGQHSMTICFEVENGIIENIFLNKSSKYELEKYVDTV